jgi:hypothetical protein
MAISPFPKKPPGRLRESPLGHTALIHREREVANRKLPVNCRWTCLARTEASDQPCRPSSQVSARKCPDVQGRRQLLLCGTASWQRRTRNDSDRAEEG